MSFSGIRAAEPADEAALRRLEGRCPQGTALRMHSERRDYFYRASLFENHRTLVAVHQGTIFAVLGAAFKQVYLTPEVGAGDEAVPAIMLFDLRLDPEYRGTVAGRQILRCLLMTHRWAEELGARIVYGVVKADNAPMIAIERPGHGYTYSGGAVFVSRPVFRRLSVDLEPEEVDLSVENGAMARVVAAEYGNRDLFPAEFRTCYLTDRMRRTGLFSCYRLVDGDSWASVGFYRVARQMWSRILSLPWYYRPARAATSALRPLVRLPVIPRKGETLSYCHLFNHLAFGPRGTELWRQIVRYLNNLTLDESATIMTSMFDPADRFLRLYRNGAINTIDYRVIYHAIGENTRFSFSSLAPDVRDMD